MSVKMTSTTAARMMGVSVTRVQQLDAVLRPERDPVRGHRLYTLESVQAWLAARAAKLAELEANAAKVTP